MSEHHQRQARAGRSGARGRRGGGTLAPGATSRRCPWRARRPSRPVRLGSAGPWRPAARRRRGRAASRRPPTTWCAERSGGTTPRCSLREPAWCCRRASRPCPSRITTVVRTSRRRQSAWPHVTAADGTTVDASVIPERGAPTRIAMLSGFTEGWYELIHANGRADRVTWDAGKLPVPVGLRRVRRHERQLRTTTGSTRSRCSRCPAIRTPAAPPVL